RPVLALVTALPLEGQPALPFPGGSEAQPPWFVYEQLQEVFDVRPVELTAQVLPEDTDLLLVVHPKGISEATEYAIDQYVLGGGHALIFVDPHCERDQPPRDPNNPLAQFQAQRSSNLERLFRAWGLQMPSGWVVADRDLAVRVQSGSRTQPKEVDYVLWLNLGREQVDPDDVVTADLGRMLLATAGSLEPLEGATTELQPLLRTTDQAMRVEQEKIQFMPDPDRLLAEYLPGGRTLTLAARVRGPVKTAFPDGPPRPAVTEDSAEPPASPPGLAESAGPIEVLVVADADLLGDDLWVQMQSFLGQRMAIPIASNGDFAVHALDNLSGSNDLISLRNRARFDRPFELIEGIRREAEQRLLAREQQLQDELSQTERRLTELQSKKDDASSLILSPEQRAEIERFQEQRVATRKALREVRHDLNKDIDRVEAWIKAVNIGAVPLLVGALAAGLGLRAGRRRSA
ncbi:MAG TPA: Gldg family protein, partial [Planctomycetota bacterium]|nr:Gldg family protein [Planctomycetota bacterium]